MSILDEQDKSIVAPVVDSDERYPRGAARCVRPIERRAVRHVLIVDDEPAICEVVQVGLEMDSSCRVTRAASAEAALAALRDPPDAAIVDAVLPRVSGLALARALVDIGIPVLIICGEPEYQRKLTRAGCPFLAKPFSFSQLHVETQALLEKATHRTAQLATSLARLSEARHELAHILLDSHRLAEEARRVIECAKADCLVIEESRLSQNRK